MSVLGQKPLESMSLMNLGLKLLARFVRASSRLNFGPISRGEKNE